jgi:hypothetical protein
MKPYEALALLSVISLASGHHEPRQTKPTGPLQKGKRRKPRCCGECGILCVPTDEYHEGLRVYACTNGGCGHLFTVNKTVDHKPWTN